MYWKFRLFFPPRVYRVTPLRLLFFFQSLLKVGYDAKLPILNKLQPNIKKRCLQWKDGEKRKFVKCLYDVLPRPTHTGLFSTQGLFSKKLGFFFYPVLELN